MSESSKVLRIKMVVDPDSTDRVTVTNADTGEEIRYIKSIRFDAHADNDPVILVEIVAECELEYHGPATLLDIRED